MWAQVSMTPFHQYKAGSRRAVSERAHRQRSAVKRPKGSINMAHARGRLMPTLLEIAGTSYPKTREGTSCPRSWASPGARCWLARPSPTDGPGLPGLGNLRQPGVRQGDWKLRWDYKPLGKATGSFSYLATDPGAQGLAAELPDKVRTLVTLWTAMSGRTT